MTYQEKKDYIIFETQLAILKFITEENQVIFGHISTFATNEELKKFPVFGAESCTKVHALVLLYMLDAKLF